MLDNSDGGARLGLLGDLDHPPALDRDGEGEYRLNGARCRLVDVLEVLSDTGLGKEMHSVVSQGRVESIIHSKPRDRRLLIEEAAGLGKHRKRRRRAQLKLERTEDNLARSLDVEREARSRLRPLKRQAEAAELHQRLERAVARGRLRAGRGRPAGRASATWPRRSARPPPPARQRDEAERLLAEVAKRREAAEEAFAEHSRAREQLSSSLFAARAAADADRAAGRARPRGGAGRRRTTPPGTSATPRARGGSAGRGRAPAPRSGSPRSRPSCARSTRSATAGSRSSWPSSSRSGSRPRTGATPQRPSSSASGRPSLEAEHAVEEARTAQRQAERDAEAARAAAAKAGAELAAVNQFLRTAAAAPDGARTLADELKVEPGFELAVAAALGSRLRAGVVGSLGEGEALLDGAARRRQRDHRPPTPARPSAAASPCAGARRLLDHVHPPADLRAGRRAAARRRLARRGPRRASRADFTRCRHHPHAAARCSAPPASFGRRPGRARSASSRPAQRSEELIAASEQAAAARGRRTTRP